jgi:hypothetical protein
MGNGLFKRAALVVLICSLGSCSIGYDIDVLLRGNQLVFRFAQSGWFSGGKAVPVRAVFVERLSDSSPVVWQLESNDHTGQDIRELRYGTLPSGMTQKGTVRANALVS